MAPLRLAAWPRRRKAAAAGEGYGTDLVNEPAPFEHGKLANPLLRHFRREGPAVCVIIDGTTVREKHSPTVAELNAATWHYLGGHEYTISQTERDLSHMRWYGVLACYKLGIILEGTNARAAAGKAEKATGDALHNQTVGLFRRALRWID